MKTAMKELQDALEIYSRHNKGTPEGKAIDIILSGLPKFIEAEKEQIIDASVQANLRYDTGANEPVLLRYCNDAEQYYQQTFKSDE